MGLLVGPAPHDPCHLLRLAARAEPLWHNIPMTKPRAMLSQILLISSLLLLSLFLLPKAQADTGSSSEWLQESSSLLPVIGLRQLEHSQANQVMPNDTRGSLSYLAVSATVTKLETLSATLQDLPVYLPDRYTETGQVKALEQEKFFPLLNPEKGRPVLYIHGYNESFDRSVRRALLLRQQLNLQDRLILLSWPSDGNLINYTRDEADMYWAVPYISQVLQNLAAHYGKGGFDLIAHSLGGRGMSLALALLHDIRPELRPIAAQTILVAPDMDAQIFADLQQKIVANTQGLTLYTSKLDEPLLLSESLHGYPRLGQTGEHSKVFEGFDVIDVTGVPRRRPSGHNYHLGSPAIQQDMRAILDEQPTEKRPLNARVFLRHWRLQP